MEHLRGEVGHCESGLKGCGGPVLGCSRDRAWHFRGALPVVEKREQKVIPERPFRCASCGLLIPESTPLVRLDYHFAGEDEWLSEKSAFFTFPVKMTSWKTLWGS